MGICRLSDSAGNRGKFNLSLEAILPEIRTVEDGQFARKLHRQLKTVKGLCVPIHEWRDKRIAHQDRHIALPYKQNAPLPNLSRAMIEDVLSGIREFMQLIERRYHGSETAYTEIVLPEAGDALLAVLKMGLRYQEMVDHGDISLEEWQKTIMEDA